MKEIESQNTNSIEIQYEEDDYINIAPQNEIEKWALLVFKHLHINNRVLSIYFTNDEIIKELNCTYRNKDYVTDVLSFPQTDEDEFFDTNFLGDIAISIPQTIRQANELNNSVDNELKFLILHGILHLLGYDHETDGGEMDKIENDIYYKLTGDNLE